jgi:TRAP-type C4-dicarboxylate transport system substrate-binding protein
MKGRIVKTTFKLALTAVLAGSLFATGTTVMAQEKIVLRAADYVPPSHYLIRYAVKYWIDNVVKQSNGRIEVRHFPSEQLGKAKDMLSLTQSGVADVAGVVPSFVSDRMPLSKVVEEISSEWVRDGAKRGKPADAVYKAYRTALDKPVEK